MPDDSVSSRSDNSANDANNGVENAFDTSPGSTSDERIRTDSENSDKWARYVLPSLDGSPPRVMTFDEVTHVVKNIQNMQLAHEIALNPDFKLQPYEPPKDSLEWRIKEVMHKAFWDLLREDLQQNPPVYARAMQLLLDIKACFPEILLPNNKRTLDQINEVLDTELINQQVEQGVLDFKSYAKFVIDIMAKSCAPARDDAVQKLTEIEDVVETFRGILEVMQLIKLDMANFLLDYARNDILVHSVEYEKEKFKEYLEYYKFGFPATENWLKRNQYMMDNNQASKPDQTISNAYLELINWDPEKDFPEVLSTDKERIMKFGQRARRVCACACLISLCNQLPVISERKENRSALAKQIEILLQDVTTEEELTEAVENVWEQIKTVINSYLQKEVKPVMDPTIEETLKKQVMQVGDKNSAVRTLMFNRIKNYLRFTLLTKTEVPIPPSYEEFKDELQSLASAFKRVIGYNHSVFADYFRQVLTQPTRPSTEPAENTNDASSTANDVTTSNATKN